MRRQNSVKITVTYMLLIIGAIFILLPFIWMITTSLKPSNEVLIMPPKWIPSKLMWENYKIAFQSAPFKRYFINSIFVTTVVTLCELFTTILAAFAFSRIRFKGRDILFSILIATMMVPGEVLIIPNFVTLSNLGWIDTYKALIIPWCASIFAIFLLRQYFLGIPEQLYYAAKIDGCSDSRYLWSIMVPIAKPALMTLAILKIVGSWNSFMWPLIVTNSDNMRTLPVALSAFSSEAGTQHNVLMAASTMIIFPVFIIYLILQKHIVAGVSRTGMKG
ncbi:putative carbohydrate uptake ABC transporter permease protein [Gottschalkia acidurici 9a]|uniref:Carbohydrate uptake ABC transporter permease protein n=1 Tax=Gottschalkia acidurici (strain ATCC 7906 / DSM 604 / BCRC 14475 / CIP 104303 / KCTC 5404 / NCIMB 10678 / 9a) TaxID=1128398 RepID=K0B1U9_GOTA9|nr:carbohydrate ABC transporter permease [Gottschalkia acidurici]AFS79434.1 putative carbohydrate uptake ABC transporter permease protein [Gottschalkia acidurici 9a]